MPTIKITGMNCAHCVSSVTKVLNDLDGISETHVNLENAEASYTESTPVPPEIIQEAITKIGFKVAKK